MKIDENKIENVLLRGVENIYPNKEALEKKLKSGDKIKLYCGYDPTAPTLHIGHAITLLKLAQFQELGHEVIMLIGDFTGMIGDPTDKATVRKKLTRQEVLKNSERYKKLASKILNFDGENPAKILYNSEWNDKLSYVDIIELASNFTAQQMFARDMFQERIKNDKPIYLHEFLYPLTQAYDSVAIDVDLEIGGNDQTFNMLVGRDLMKAVKNKEKFVLTTKLLVDSSGKKMGKSEGNMVALDDEPVNMLGKIMSWPDELIIIGFELCTSLLLNDIDEINEQMKSDKLNPRDAKMQLAKEIVTIFHNKEDADRAEQEFEKVFKEKEVPSEIIEVIIKEDKINLPDFLTESELTPSKTEAKRLIEQGAVKINDKVIKDWKKEVKIDDGAIIQVGKRRFVRIIK
ncbi:MAG: tyrosine--tRNA ligase [bacterium]